MSPIDLAILAIAAPAAVAALLAVVHPLRTGRVAASLSIAAVLVSLGSAVALLAAVLAGASGEATTAWIPGTGSFPVAEIGVRVDGVSASMLVAVTLVAACVQIFSVRYLDGDPPRAVGRYFTYQSLFVVSMGTLTIAPNLLQLFIGWELVGVTSYLLIGHWYRRPSAARAAVKAFWLTKLADVGLIFALLVIFRATGTFSWTAALPEDTATTATLLLLLAVAGKSAQFPLHVWLPDAMEGPTPVSALLHAATMVAAGVFLIVRAFPLFEAAPTTQLLMAHAGAFTAVFAACLAVVQTDVKKMLAYSTCSQLGYMIAALGAGSLLGGYFHLLTHAAFKALLFLAAGNVIHAVGGNDMRAMGGLFPRMKLTAIAFIVGAAALAGIPGLAGAFSKDLILEATAHRWPVAFALLLAGVPLTAYYMGRAVMRVFFGAPQAAAHHAHEAPASMLGPLLVLAVPAALAGHGGATLASLTGGAYHFHLGAITIAATLLAFAGLGAAFAVSRGGALAGAADRATSGLAALARAAVIDRAWLAAFRSLLLPVAAAAAWFDRYVVDALVNASGALGLAAGRRLRPVQTGYVPDYLYALGAAVALLALWGVIS